MDIYNISYMWYSGVACMIVMVIGMVTSLITNQEMTPVHPNLLASGVENLFCCWPRQFKRWIAMKEMFSSHKYVASATEPVEENGA